MVGCPRARDSEFLGPLADSQTITQMGLEQLYATSQTVHLLPCTSGIGHTILLIPFMPLLSYPQPDPTDWTGGGSVPDPGLLAPLEPTHSYHGWVQQSVDCQTHSDSSGSQTHLGQLGLGLQIS